ncbi:MAG: hypothetical protein FD159_303 [Syntrophaceae bacterium]|nr:MAG: hypothetical protein FD159_303 [Syntrophaceae bacterium]
MWTSAMRKRNPPKHEDVIAGNLPDDSHRVINGRNCNHPSLDGRGRGRVRVKAAPSPQSPPARGGEVS